MHNFFRTWKVKEVEKVHKELAKDYMDLFVRYRQAEDKVLELEKELEIFTPLSKPITYKEAVKGLEEAEENDKMIIKKKKEITMKEYLHMLVDKGTIESLSFNREDSDYWHGNNNVKNVNIGLLTNDDFPHVEIYGGFNKETMVTLIEEIEIDEDTEFERLIEVNKSGAIHTFYDTSINEELWYGSSEFHIAIDDKLVKIWDKDEEMLE